MIQIPEQLKELIEKSKLSAIIVHRNPDGDALGSALALQSFLQKKGHKTHVISPNEIPGYLKWLPETEEILIYETNPEKIQNILKDSEIIFTLDFNDLSRSGKDLEKFLKKLKAKTFVMIDHHLEPSDYARFMFSDSSKSSTSEMVYDFIVTLGHKNDIDRKMATTLYTGIMTDTGSFKFPNTTSQTMRIAADLMDKGINHNEIQTKIFDSFSLDKLHLLGEALNKLVFLPQYKTAYIALGKDELKKHHYQKGDTEGFVNYGLALKDADFAVMFLENENEGVRISFRSKGNFPANEFAKKYFNGGGHLNAAGGKTSKSLEETIRLFLEKLPEFINRLQLENA